MEARQEVVAGLVGEDRVVERDPRDAREGAE